jgi:hypothetical protein
MDSSLGVMPYIQQFDGSSAARAAGGLDMSRQEITHVPQ